MPSSRDPVFVIGRYQVDEYGSSWLVSGPRITGYVDVESFTDAKLIASALNFGQNFAQVKRRAQHARDAIEELIALG